MFRYLVILEPASETEVEILDLGELSSIEEAVRAGLEELGGDVWTYQLSGEFWNPLTGSEAILTMQPVAHVMNRKGL